MVNVIDSNTLPNLILNKFTASGVGNIQENLCSRQVITIPFEEGKFKFEILSEFERGIYDSIDKVGESVDFSQMPDDVIKPCIYNGSTNCFITPEDYMTYIKRVRPATIKVVVYGVELATDTIPKIIDQYVTKEIALPTLDNLTLETELLYRVFEDTQYNVIKAGDSNYYILNINIPYSYYSRIPLIDSTFSYDINTHQFYEDGDKIDIASIVERFVEIHNNELEHDPFPGTYILANNNELAPSNTNSDGSDIFIAKLLKLPFIPASLVVSDAQIPFCAQKGKHCQISAIETNELCKPYFIFTE